jgi:DNA-binding beta-propeller fold protein YncE
MTRLIATGCVLCAASALVSGQQPAAPGAATAMIIVAGQGTPGFADGRGAEARFNKPIRLAPLGPAAVVVSDIYNHAIRVVSKDGKVATLAGAPDRKGHQDGPAAAARFSSPHGVATAADGRIAVAEAEGHTLRLMTPSRAAAGGYEVSTIAGTPGTSGAADGPAARALFNSPHAALWGGDGALYAPDIGNRTIRRLKNGQVETVAGQVADTFVYPMDIAWMKDGRMIVADAGSNLLRTWRPGEPVGTLAVRGVLATPHGVASGPDGTIYVADMKSHRVLAIDQAGAVTTFAGVEGEAGGDRAHLNRPAAVLVHAGWLWIADLDNHRITAIDLGRGK